MTTIIGLVTLVSLLIFALTVQFSGFRLLTFATLIISLYGIEILIISVFKLLINNQQPYTPPKTPTTVISHNDWYKLKRPNYVVYTEDSAYFARDIIAIDTFNVMVVNFSDSLQVRQYDTLHVNSYYSVSEIGTLYDTYLPK